MKTAVTTSFVVFIAALAAGCATSTRVVKTYDDESVRSRPYDKVLVVSVASNIGERRRLEELITGKLVHDGTDAVAGHTIMGLSETVLQSAIDAAAIESEAEAVLVTHVISVDRDVEVREGRTDVEFECRGGDPVDYFLYDREELKLPDTVAVAHTVVAVANLYDVASNARRWSIQSTCFEKASLDEVWQDEATAIVRQLRIDGLIG